MNIFATLFREFSIHFYIINNFYFVYLYYNKTRNDIFILLIFNTLTIHYTEHFQHSLYRKSFHDMLILILFTIIIYNQTER